MEHFQSESVANSSFDEACVGHEGHLFKCEPALVFLLAAEEQILSYVHCDEAGQNDNNQLGEDQLPRDRVNSRSLEQEDVDADSCENSTLRKVAQKSKSEPTSDLSLRGKVVPAIDRQQESSKNDGGHARCFADVSEAVGYKAAQKHERTLIPGIKGQTPDVLQAQAAKHSNANANTSRNENEFKHQ